MTSNCRPTNSGRYAVKHNPWAYFTGERTRCQVDDVPSGTYTSGALHNDIVNGKLPNIGEVTPNLDNNAHDGSLGRADTWLPNWFTLIYESPALTHYSLGGLLTQLTHAPCINGGCSAAHMATAFALPLG
jgi:acid phosphatase